MKVKVVVSILISFILFTSLAVPTFALCNDFECDCGTDTPLIDFQCQQKKLVDPSSSCTILYCPSNRPATDADLSLNFFGITIRVNDETKVASLLYLGFTLFLGAVVIATVLLGVWSAYQRARAESDDDVAKTSKTLKNAIIGFVIVGLALLITQIVASLIGIGSIANMVDFTGYFNH